MQHYLRIIQVGITRRLKIKHIPKYGLKKFTRQILMPRNVNVELILLTSIYSHLKILSLLW